MSAIALVLLSTQPGREQHVVDQLNKMPEVSEAMVLFGEYDVYCKVIVDVFPKLSKLVLRNIRTIEGVLETTTLTAAYEGQ
tara:strand:+ start:3702 stop:3944 length:243 start_codon:yes stop_codon:yes gene_type:complete